MEPAGASASTHCPGPSSSPGGNEGLSPAQLIELAEEIHTTFNPDSITLDTHLESCLQEHKVKTVSDETFLRQPAQKMLPFLDFMFNEKYVKDDLTEEWLKIYDREFVRDCTDRLLSNKPALQPLFDKLKHRTCLHQQAEQAAKDGASFTITLSSKTTKLEPFNLTPAKAKPPPRDLEADEVEEISARVHVARPAPPRLEGLTKEEKAIQQHKTKNQAAVHVKYPELGTGPAKLRTDQRPGTRKIDELRAAAEAAEVAACNPPAPSKPPPPAPEAVVRINAAAILREDFTLRRRQKEEASALKRYEAELHDDVEYKEWRTKKQAEDEQLRLQQVAERRELAKNSRGAMLAATEAQLADNNTRSRNQRESAAAAAAAAAREAAAAAAATVAQCDVIREERERARGAKARMTSERSNQAAELRADVRKGLARAAHAAAQDRVEREDLVRQIRAVEKVPNTRTAKFDRTETGGHRLLDEMSIVELKARLDLVERQEREAIETARAENLRKKEARIARLTEKASNLGRVRQLAGAQAAARRRQASTAAEAAVKEEARAREEGVVKVVEKLTGKRDVQARERARIAAESKRVAFMKQQQAAGASQVEENRFLSVRDGMERTVRMQQHRWVEETTLLEKTKQRARKIDLKYAAHLRHAKADLAKQYDQQMDRLGKDQRMAQETNTVRKNAAAAAQRRAEHQQRERLAASRAPEQRKPMDIQQRLKGLATGDLEEVM